MKHDPEFILNIVQILSAVPVSDFLRDSILLCAYSPRKRAESRFWDTSETHCDAPVGIPSIVSNGHTAGGTRRRHGPWNLEVRGTLMNQYPLAVILQ